MKYACSCNATTNNQKTRDTVDKAVAEYIKAEKEYQQQRKTKMVKYSIGVRPIGDYEGSVEVWEDATEDEIRDAIFKHCEFYWYIN